MASFFLAFLPLLPVEEPSVRPYAGLGFAPARMPEQEISSELAQAVGPGYLALAGLTAVSDLRLSLQPYNWLIPRLISSAPDEADPDAGTCTYDNTIINHDDANGDGSLTLGETVEFRLGECVPAGGVRSLSANVDETEQLFQGDASGRLSRLQIENVLMSGYDNMQFSTDHWLTRQYAPDKQECAVAGEEARDCEQMSLSNQEVEPGGALAQLTIGQVNVTEPADPVLLHVWSDEGVGTLGEIHSLVNQSDHAALYRIESLHMYLETGDADRSGTYRLQSLDEGLRICHTGTKFVSDDFWLCAGGFRVTTPDDVTYTYSLAEGADPESVHVTRSDRSGADVEVGVVPREFLMQRLHLSGQ